MENIERNSEVIGILDYGVGNLLSLGNALDYLHIPYKIIKIPDELNDVKRIILPGVGSFRYAMDKLVQNDFKDELIKKIKSKNYKLLGICLGMQLLYESSEENGGCQGLGVINGYVKRISNIDGDVRIPNIGWRKITVFDNSSLLKDLPDEPIFYFVHSYACYSETRNIVKGQLYYGNIFDVILESENIYATQFHPEKSQVVGLHILKRFASI